MLCVALCGALRAQTPLAGKEYQELRPAVPIPAGERIEVIEFFYYGCAVCYEAQPHLARWLAGSGANVALLRVPAVFTESSESFARTFYALGAMNEIARLHWPLYDNHHFDGRQLNEYRNIVKWVAANGVDRARFEALWRSEAVNVKIDSAKKSLDTYHVKGVPSLVVDGKYLTSAKMAGGTREMVRVAEYLVGRAAVERKTAERKK
jgi:thiol:disulfide interchange protein DsbA